MMLISVVFWVSVSITPNVLQLQEVGDFGDENCLPVLNLIRSTKLQLTTEPPIFCRCCACCTTKIQLLTTPQTFPLTNSH